MVSDVGIPFSSGNEAFALMFPYFRFFESIIDVNRAHGIFISFKCNVLSAKSLEMYCLFMSNFLVHFLIRYSL